MGIRRRSLVLRVVLVGLLLALAGAEWLLQGRRARYVAETARLRAGMTALERARADALLAAEEDRTALALALIRRQAAGDEALHLAVSAESGYVALERGAVRLRRFAAELAPDHSFPRAPSGETVRGGAVADPEGPPAHLPIPTPRGLRHVERVVGAGDPVPAVPWWPGEPPASRWPTPLAVVASGGVLIYARPDSGALAAPGRILPGAVRVAADDLEAIRGSITPGMRVYFF